MNPAFSRLRYAILGIGAFAVCLSVFVVHVITRSETADQLWSHIQTLQKSPQLERDEALGDLLMKFVERYPSDVRRWDAVLALTTVERPEFEGSRDPDEVAEKAWRARVNAQIKLMIASPSVPDDKMQAAYESWVGAAIEEDVEPRTTTQLTELRQRIDALHARFPNADTRVHFEQQYLEMLRDADQSDVLPYLTKLGYDPDVRIARWARGESNTERLRQAPMELSVATLDGRVVDLAKLRGKVVLVDFWATYCVPCVEEVPGLLAAYQKLHAQGFEIVALSQDRLKDRDKLLKFIAQRHLPWPQHFDNVQDENPIALHYGIEALPSTFLLDKSGRLAKRSVWADELEAEVERLLKM